MNVLDFALCFESSIVEWKHKAPSETQGMKIVPKSNLDQQIHIRNAYIKVYGSKYIIVMVTDWSNPRTRNCAERTGILHTLKEALGNT